MKTRPFRKQLRKALLPGSTLNRRLVGILAGWDLRVPPRLHPQALRTLIPGYHLNQRQARLLLAAVAEALQRPPS